MASRLRHATAVGAVAVVVVGSAVAGSTYVCHPDPEGTRTLALRGDVGRYAFRGNTVSLLVGGAGTRCRRVVWRPGAAKVSPAERCDAPRHRRTRASSGRSTVTLQPGSVDVPDRLVVSGPAGRHSWPLPEPARHVDLAGPTALVATQVSREAYAVDIRSGKAAIVGLIRRFDTPQIEPAGIVFRDNLDKEAESSGTTLMKFVPARHVRHALRTVGRPLRVPGRLVDLAMDGSRVALAVRDFRGECDAVVFWNVTWRYSVPITEEDEHTCRWSRRGGSIRSVSIAGLRAAWTITLGRTERVLSASSVDCFERIVATARSDRGERVLGHDGDEGVLAYGLSAPGSATLGRVGKRMRAEPLVRLSSDDMRLSVDDRRIASWRKSGEVVIRDRAGALLSSFQIAQTKALALRGHRFVALTSTGTLDVHDASSGVRLASWPVPSGAARVDVHFGVAVLTATNTVYAVSLETGRVVELAREKSAVSAAIEAPGVAYLHQSGPVGTVKFISFGQIERRLGLSPR